MDVEKAIQALIEGDVKAQKRADRADELAAERHKRAMERADKFDKQLKATADLVRAGLKLVIQDRKLAKEEWKKQAERNKEIDFKLNALIDSQNRSDERMRKFDEKWDRWLDELRKNRGNGHS